jgi:hypothetical protein
MILFDNSIYKIWHPMCGTFNRHVLINKKCYARIYLLIDLGPLYCNLCPQPQLGNERANEATLSTVHRQS